MALIPNVVPQTRITSVWGNLIRDRTVEAFATKAELDAQWSAAPDGAVAITLDTSRLWVRRGGLWLPPLTLPLGLYYEGGLDTAQARTIGNPPGIEDWAGVFDQELIYGQRILLVTFTVRYALNSATANVTLGGAINVTGTGLDTPLTFHGGNVTFANLGGQEACVMGWPLTFQNAAYRSSVTGLFKTGGVPGQQLSISFQHVMLGTPGAVIGVQNRHITVVDMGPNV